MEWWIKKTLGVWWWIEALVLWFHDGIVVKQKVKLKLNL